jgi:murein DD-endopeptidase MepM/ murein hydrolase activator NlpD
MAVLLAGSAAGQHATVRPGGIARWEGMGTSACEGFGRTWAPTGDACFFPVDLEAEGTLEIARVREGRRESARLRIGDYPYPTQRLTVEERMVHLSKEDLERVRRENARIARVWERESRPRATLPLAAPLQPLPAGGRFGARRIFNDVPRSPHSGADYKAAPGTPVLAAGDGVVALSGDFFFPGKAVFIDHGGGLVTMYFHLSRIDVKEGDEVERGQRIGSVGSTGRSTGPHLHFGVRWHGQRIDPALLLAESPELAVLE